ncbi:MAG: hypothetical protein ACKOZU_05030 [Planctomycetaceae bacterium]
MHSAIVLAEESWIAARALAAWLDSGQRVAKVRCRDRSSLTRPVRQPLAVMFPAWSVRRLLRAHGIPLRRVPPLRTWTAALGGGAAAATARAA